MKSKDAFKSLRTISASSKSKLPPFRGRAEEHIANRIADQKTKLAALLKQREALIGAGQSDAQE